jgi:hypothetical protein
MTPLLLSDPECRVERINLVALQLVAMDLGDR